MTQFIDSIIIGGGQAGLAMSQCLTTSGIEHLVFERGQIGERWRSERWPSLRLLTPGWMTRMPGQALATRGDGFLTSQDLVTRLETYSANQRVPLMTDTEVISVNKLADLYRVVTSRGTWITRSVVVATGACDRPRVPQWAKGLSPRINQLTPDRYRRAADIAPGGVLVVGSSATGVQLAAEIARSGRETIVSVGSHVRSPRRYRGRDIFDWLDPSGFLAEAPPANRTTTELISQPSLQLVGSDQGADIDIHSLARLGVRTVGRAVGAAGATVSFSGNLADECEVAEKRRQGLLRRIDRYISENGFDVAEDRMAWDPPQIPVAEAMDLDLRAEGIGTVVWATGYRRAYPWLDLPAFDANGEIRQCGGISDLPGLYVIGIPFMRNRASTFVDGVGRDAEALAPVITAQLNTQARNAA